MSERIISLIIGYVCGLLQTSYLYGKLNHIDIREHGSGNAGATNALRTLGKKAGIITFLGDFLKPMLAALIVGLIYKDNSLVGMLECYAGFGAVMGHVFPCYLGFRGGKGVATIAGAGVWLAISNGYAYMIPVFVVLFALVVAITGYVSLGSIIFNVGYFLMIVLFGQFGILEYGQSVLYEMYLLTGIYCGICIFKHRTNIVRLVKGTENKVFQKKEK